MKKEHLHTFSFTNQDQEQEQGDITNDPNQSSTTDLVNTNNGKKNVKISKVLSNLARRSFQKKNFVRKLPILNWLPEYHVSKLVADFIAGLTLGLTTIPQVMGVANVAEIPTEVLFLLILLIVFQTD